MIKLRTTMAGKKGAGMRRSVKPKDSHTTICVRDTLILEHRGNKGACKLLTCD